MGSQIRRISGIIIEKERKKEKERIMAGVLNIGSRSEDWRAIRLSNFSFDSFDLDGVRFYSVEGFIQGIKFPEGDFNREKAQYLRGIDAKRLGRKAPPERKFVWWKGEAFLYGSVKHHALIERAIRAKFERNEGAMKALLATAGMTLTHNLGHPESPHTSLPSEIFCEILTKIREESLKKIVIDI